MASIRPKIDDRHKPCHTFRRWSVAITFIFSLLMPCQLQATPVSLALLVNGVIKTAEFAGAAMTLAQIFGGIADQSDDHPLYSAGNSSPTLSISATETSFELLLKQSNDISEFEDDLPAVLSGTAKINTNTGPADAWKFSITIESDIPTILPPLDSSLDAHGFVQHLFTPHPDLHEKSPGTALNYDLGITVPCIGLPICGYTKALRPDSDNDKKLHNNGSHTDTLHTELEVMCCHSSNGNIDFFNVSLSAQHVDNEPTAFLNVLSTDRLTMDHDLNIGEDYAGLKVGIAGQGGPGNGHGQVVAHTIELGGILSINNEFNFSPKVGSSPGENGDFFVIVTGFNVNGQFDSIQGQHIGTGKFYEVEVGAMDVKLNAFQALAGDANGDKDVDISDFHILATNFDPEGQNGPHNNWLTADFDADGEVNITDFNILATNFTEGYGKQPLGVPEPTTVILMVIGCLAVGISINSPRRM